VPACCASAADGQASAAVSTAAQTRERQVIVMVFNLIAGWHVTVRQ
jgi:hypothetical protein